MKRLRNWLRRTTEAEDGTATIPFVIFVPFFITLVVSSVEMGMFLVRSVMLERGLDMTVRDLRLGIWTTTATSANAKYLDLKTRICRNAALLPNCMNTLHLELRPVSKVTWEPLTTPRTCVNRLEDPNPPVNFSAGSSNEMMLIRACVVFDPVFPLTGLGLNMPKDSAGMYAIVATTAFVNEPRLGS